MQLKSWYEYNIPIYFIYRLILLYFSSSHFSEFLLFFQINDVTIKNINEEIKNAGANKLYNLPLVNYNDHNDVNKYKIYENSINPTATISLEMKEKKEEKEKFNVLVTNILKFFFRLDFDDFALISVIGEILPVEDENKLPSLTYGSTVIINGTVKAVNQMLREVYYYSSPGTYGTAVGLIEFSYILYLLTSL